MDIQKEREDFECEFKQTDYYIAHGDLSTLMLCDDQYALDDVQVSFEMWQAAKAQAVPETKKFNLDEFLLMEQKLKSKGGVITADLDRFIAYAEMVLEKAKALKEPK